MAGPINFTTRPDLRTEYANLVRISHSPNEVLLEFARFLPGDGNPVVISKVVMTPLAAKMMLKVLGDNLQRFEGTFGEIKLDGPDSLAETLFRQAKKPKPPQEPETDG